METPAISNWNRSASPARFMYYSDDGSWIDYPIEAAAVMKLGFRDGMIESHVRGFDSVFDFFRMIETDIDTGKQRSLAWIDVDGNCFFPKVFINDYSVDCIDNCVNFDVDVRVDGNLVSSNCIEIVNSSKNSNKIEIAVNIGGGTSLGSRENDSETSSNRIDVDKRNKRKREVSVEKETKRRVINEDEDEVVSRVGRWPKTRIMGGEEKGYLVVKDLIDSGFIGELGVRVTAVHQCLRVGPLDKARCEVFKRQMEITKKIRGGVSNMVFAWYGTSAEGVKSVLMHGFGMPSKMLSSEGHGVGVYLSHIRSPQGSAMMSDIDEHGEKHLILCRVILGKCEKVEPGSRQMYPSSVEYDTGVDDLKNPKWYTVWHSNMNTHILPEYVVSYSPVKVPGSISGAPNTKVVQDPTAFLAKLLSRLRNYLPPPRVQQLQSLCKSYKEGKLGKHIFVNQLRSVVGDDVLRSTIQEIRG